MSALQPMTPIGTVSLSATSTSGRVTLTAPATLETSDTRAMQCIVTCPPGNADIVFVLFGMGSLVVTTGTGVPCLPGSVQTFSIGQATVAAGICPTTTGTAYFTVGYGE